MKHLSVSRVVRLQLEHLEQRLQPSVGLFDDPLAADPLHAPGTATPIEERTFVSHAPEAPAEQTLVVHDAPPAAPHSGQTAGPVLATDAGATLLAALNAAGTVIGQPPQGHALAPRDVRVTEATTIVGTSAAPFVAVDPSRFTLTTTTCGAAAGTQAATWSQYRGGAGVDANFRVDATDAGVVYSAGLGTDFVAGDNPGTVTLRSGAACTTAVLGTPDSNFLILYGVNVAGAGGSVYTAGFDVFTGISYVFKLDANLTTIEVAVQSPSPVALNFSFDIVNDTAGNRYVVGMTQNQAGLNGMRLTKFDATLALPPAYDVLVTFTDGPGGPALNSVGLSLDVDAAGEAYAGGGIVYGANDVRNVVVNLNAAGTTVDWAEGLDNGPGVPLGANGGSYGVAVQGDSVSMTGIIADPVLTQNDNLLLARWQLDGSIVAAAAWALRDGGDAQGYALDVSADAQPLVAGAVAGSENDPDVDALLIKFGPDLDTIVGDDLFGNTAFDPGKDDDAYGLALIGGGATADIAVAGDTASDDFAPILNACAGADTFGGLVDGWMMRYAQPLP